MIFTDIIKFKQHIFMEHVDMDVQAKYCHSLQSLIGVKYLQRLREPLFQKLLRGEFMTSVAEVAQRRYDVNCNGAKYLYSYHIDPDEKNKEKRWAKYMTQRELLLRIIHDDGEEEQRSLLAFDVVADEKYLSKLSWDLF
jgi:hypothetical protein